MLSHWEHTAIITKEQYDLFTQHNQPIELSTLEDYIPPNTAVYIQSEDGSKPLEAICDPSLKALRRLNSSNQANRDLRLFEDTMKNENITVIAVDGFMGTGKTSTTIEHLITKHLADVHPDPHFAYAEESIKDRTDRHNILISKPDVNAGDESYGFLPGDLVEKFLPKMRNYTQYFDRNHPSGFNLLNRAGYVDILPLGFVRGMDATNTSVIVDECQNTKELVTMVSRRAKGTRIFLIGDTSPFQIDVKGNTTENNGLTHIIDLLKGASYFQYIEMKSVEHIVRSEEVRDLVRRLFKKYGDDVRNWKG